MREIFDPFAQQVIVTALSALTSALCAWAVSTARKSARDHADQDEALKIGMQTILRADILDAYRSFVLCGEPLHIERKRELVAEHEAYIKLGGNGTLGEHSTIWRDLDEVQIASEQ